MLAETVIIILYIFMQAHEEYIREKLQNEIRTMSAIPKKWRTLLDKKLTEMETQEEEEMASETSVTLITPAVTSRTRAATKKDQQSTILKKAKV